MSTGKVTKAIDEVTAKTPGAVIVAFRQGAGDKTDVNIATKLPNHYITKQMFYDNSGNAPLVLEGVNSNTVQGFDIGNFITYILIKTETGAPSLNIGLTDGGGEILSTSPIGGFLAIHALQYFIADGNLYFDISGGGSVNIYIYYLSNIV